MRKISQYEWGEVWADERDPNAGGASHKYEVRLVRELAPPGLEPDGQNVMGEWSPAVEVQFQHGPRNEKDSILGALDDHILAIVQDRMEAFQAGPFPCDDNADALGFVRAARKVLRHRAEERRARNVLGKNVP